MLGRFTLILVLTLQQTLLRPCGAIERSRGGVAAMACGMESNRGDNNSASCAGSSCTPAVIVETNCCCSCAPADEPISPTTPPAKPPHADDAGSMLPTAVAAPAFIHDTVALPHLTARLPLSIHSEGNNLRRARLCVWLN